MVNQNFYELLTKNIPNTKVESVHLFHNTVLIKTSDSVGVSTITDKGICPPPKDYGKLQHKTLNELAQYYLSDNYLEVAVGMAAINAAYNKPELLTENNTDINAYDLILNEGKGKNVAIIGGFPFIERLKDKFETKNLWVFELNPRYDYELSIDKYGEYLPKADIVIMTATTLVNKTFHKIYPHLTNSFNIIAGPTTPMTEMFFEYNIHALSGMIVEDFEQAFLSFSQGAASKYAKGVRKFTLK